MVVTLDFGSEFSDSELSQLVKPRNRSILLLVLILVEAALEVKVFSLTVVRAEELAVKLRAPLLHLHGDGVPTLRAVPVDGAS